MLYKYGSSLWMLSILSISLLVCGSHMTASYSSTDLTLDRYAILLNSWGPLFLLSSCIHDKHKTDLFSMIYFMLFSNGHQTGKHRVRMSNRSEGM